IRYDLVTGVQTCALPICVRFKHFAGGRRINLETGKTFGTVESVKAVSEIYAPASGEVLEANAELHNTPEKLYTDPHGAAWLIKAIGRASGRERVYIEV